MNILVTLNINPYQSKQALIRIKKYLMLLESIYLGKHYASHLTQKQDSRGLSPKAPKLLKELKDNN